MAQRCEHCKHWVDMVFKGQSASGYGVWYGDCHHPNTVMHDRNHHSLYIACHRFEAGTHPRSLAAAMAAQADPDQPVINQEKDQP